MHGLILAGGEGSRLRVDGVTVPKPLVQLDGQPQIRRLVDTFFALGCESLTCLIRDDMPEVGPALAVTGEGQAPSIVWCHTPSSLHTLVMGLRQVPPGPVFCSMVDTVMRPDDWRRAFAEVQSHLAAGTALVLIVTPFVDDENPLHVLRDPRGFVTRVGGEPGPTPCVTGGVYGLGPPIRDAAEECLASGVHRMRGFLQRVVALGQPVATVEIPRIIDLDRKRDLELADGWVQSGFPDYL
jgi:molybdopterin-guanine dinucleotide biosynthesis protein A